MTDRIEAIRARLESRKAFRVRGVTTWTSEADEDVSWLLTELRRARFHEQNNFANWKEAEAKVRRVQALVDAAEERSPIGAAYDRAHPDETAAVLISTRDLRDALTPVAPDAEQRTRDLFLAAALEDGPPNDLPTEDDAEPTEWEWSPGDVVQDPEDGTVLAREADGTYPWRSTNGVDQRDQDITDLVTKHGGRVLVCKARGIGVGGAS